MPVQKPLSRSGARKPGASNNRGFSIPEVLMAVAAFAIMMVMFSPMFSLSQRAFTSLEITTSIKDGGQKVLNIIALDLNQCRRLFQYSTDVNSDNYKYRANVVGQLGSLPAVPNWSFLPRNNPYAALSPSDYQWNPDYIGNSLFLASVDRAQDLAVKDFTALDQTIRVDTYRFNFYYLALTKGDIGRKPLRNLYEWHSVSFADYNEISGINDPVMSSQTINNLMVQGVKYAWDPTASYDNAFHLFSYVGGCATVSLPPSLPPAIEMRSGGPAFKILTGSGGGSWYRYGVSPNTDDVLYPVPPNGNKAKRIFMTKTQVPNMASLKGDYTNNFGGFPDFPSGFEVIMAGPAGEHLVFVRLVLIASGDAKVIYSKEHILLVSARDPN